MSNEKNVAKTIDTCITKLQEVKKQWSHCVKRYIYIQTKTLTNQTTDGGQGEPNDNEVALLNKLSCTSDNVSTDKSKNVRNDSILKNCTVGEMLDWALANGKKEKLLRIIQNRLKYKDLINHESGFWDQQRTAEKSDDDIFEDIHKTFKGKKYGKIAKGSTAGETELIIDLVAAVFDSIVGKYIGLIRNGVDKKTRHRMIFGGIKGKDLEKYLFKKAGLNLNVEGNANFSEGQMLYNLDKKRRDVENVKNEKNISDLYNSFKKIQEGTAGVKIKTAISVNKEANECMNDISKANEALKTVQTSLAKIITEEELHQEENSDSAEANNKRVTPKRKEQ